MKIVYILISVVLIGLLTSCNRKSADSPYSISFLACNNEENDKEAMLDRNGQLFSISQENVWDVTSVINGYCIIDEKLYKVGADIADTTVIAKDVESCGVMNEGLIPISKWDDYITIIDELGNEVSTLKEFEGKEVLCCYSYSDSKLRVMLEDKSFVYVDKTGNCEDKDYISISYDLELLSAKENDKIIIYDFNGKRVLQCPSKVYGIYAFCQDGFIYYNEDEEFGLMSYDGEQLIRAKYEQLVSNGSNYLALIDDNDEAVKLIDAEDNVIKEFDGEDICDFKHLGYDYPNLIETSDGHFIMIGENGDIIKDDLNIDFDFDEYEYYNLVLNNYFPQEQVINNIMNLCGRGTGLTNNFGAFFGSEKHCYPKDITFLSSTSKSTLEGSYRARKYIGTGINYEIYHDVVFDEPIVRKGSKSLSTTAWLIRAEIYFHTRDAFRNQAVLNCCVNELRNNGCSIFYSKATDYILYNKNKDQLLVVVHNENRKYGFGILMMPNTESNRNIWKGYIDNLK